jgi:ABC-type lipoprotein release transport system permease subunit
LAEYVGYDGGMKRVKIGEFRDRAVASLLIIVAACLLAAWVPARRASHLDPMRTLRQE